MVIHKFTAILMDTRTLEKRPVEVQFVEGIVWHNSVVSTIRGLTQYRVDAMKQFREMKTQHEVILNVTLESE